MTKAEKFIHLAQQIPDELSIELSADSPDGPPEISYVAELKPGDLNPLHIMDLHHGDPAYDTRSMDISYESAVELSKFLKELFLDEDLQK
jgi:hypothetical protein